MENVGDIEKINNLAIESSAEMAINCEWASNASNIMDASGCDIQAGCVRLIPT